MARKKKHAPGHTRAGQHAGAAFPPSLPLHSSDTVHQHAHAGIGPQRMSKSGSTMTKHKPKRRKQRTHVGI